MSDYPDLATLKINNMDVTSKQKKKIIKYIIDDRARKLGKYLDRDIHFPFEYESGGEVGQNK